MRHVSQFDKSVENRASLEPTCGKGSRKEDRRTAGEGAEGELASRPSIGNVLALKCHDSAVSSGFLKRTDRFVYLKCSCIGLMADGGILSISWE